MNRGRTQDNGKHLAGKDKAHWGKLSDDDFGIVARHRGQRAGKIQRYGIAEEEAEKQMAMWDPTASEERKEKQHM